VRRQLPKATRYLTQPVSAIRDFGRIAEVFSDLDLGKSFSERSATMKNGSLARTVFVFDLFTGAAITVEALAFYSDSAVTEACGGPYCD
jgi:hypothetical protein